MLSNAYITLYSRYFEPTEQEDVWICTEIPEVWHFKQSKSSISEKGLARADTNVVRIWDVSVKIKKGDYIKVNGGGSIESPRDLDGEYFKVTGVNYNSYGENPHIKVVGE